MKAHKIDWTAVGDAALGAGVWLSMWAVGVAMIALVVIGWAQVAALMGGLAK